MSNTCSLCNRVHEKKQNIKMTRIFDLKMLKSHIKLIQSPKLAEKEIVVQKKNIEEEKNRRIA